MADDEVEMVRRGREDARAQSLGNGELTGASGGESRSEGEKMV